MGKSTSRRSHKSRWPSVIMGLGIALGVILVLALAVTSYLDAARPGELVFAEDSVDVGHLALGQEVTYRFSMRNSGAKPVTIKKKSASALEGC